jgi:predicted DNA binding CopG/RHH family protein
MPAQRQQTLINLEAVFEALERPLALVEDEQRRASFQRYLVSVRIHLERSILDLLAGAVQAVNEAEANVRARLEYQAGTLHLVVEPAEEEAAADQDRLFNIDDEVEKVTIRLPSELKDLISQAASSRGVSINSWYIRELANAVRNISRELRQNERRQEREVRIGQRMRERIEEQVQREAERQERRAQQEAERIRRGAEREVQRGSLKGFIGQD